MGEQSLPSARTSEDRLDSWKEIAAYLNRDVTTVQRWEKREGMPVHRHLHDRMGSVYASRAELDAWTRGRNPRPAQDNGNNTTAADPPVSLPQPAISTSRTRGKFVLPLAAAAAVLAIGASLWLQRTEYFWRNPIANARFQAVTDFGGVEQAAAVSRDGHLVAFLSDRDGQTDVWLTQAGSGQFHNLTRGSVVGTRQSIGPHTRVFPRRLSRHVLGSQATRLERRRHQCLGGANAGWTAEAIPRRRGRVRLVSRRLPARVSHARTRRPSVRLRRYPANGRPAHLHGACRAPLSLSLVVSGRGFHLLRPGSAPGQIGHLAYSFSRRNSPTDHVPQRTCKLPGPGGSAHAAVSRNRLRWLGAVAL